MPPVSLTPDEATLGIAFETRALPTLPAAGATY